MFPVITWEMLLTPDNGLYDIYALYFFAKKVTNHLVHIDGHWHLQSNLSQIGEDKVLHRNGNV